MKVNFMTSPVAQGGSFVQRQRMPWWSSLEADDDPRYRWTFDFFSTGGLVQGHGKSSWRSGTRPMFLGIAPGMGSIGIMDLSWNGVGSRVFRLSLLSLSALCVLSFIGVHPCVFRVLSEKPWQGYLVVNSTPAPALNCAQNSSCPFLLQFSACW